MQGGRSRGWINQFNHTRGCRLQSNQSNPLYNFCILQTSKLTTADNYISQWQFPPTLHPPPPPLPLLNLHHCILLITCINHSKPIIISSHTWNFLVAMKLTHWIKWINYICIVSYIWRCTVDACRRYIEIYTYIDQGYMLWSYYYPKVELSVRDAYSMSPEHSCRHMCTVDTRHRHHKYTLCLYMYIDVHNNTHICRYTCTTGTRMCTHTDTQHTIHAVHICPMWTAYPLATPHAVDSTGHTGGTIIVGCVVAQWWSPANWD